MKIKYIFYEFSIYSKLKDSFKILILFNNE
jgi:hypothetical protein